MTISRLAGIALFAIGCILLFFGLNATNTLGEKIVEGVTGKYTHDTMLYIVGGVAAGTAGLALVLFGRRKA